MLTFTKKAIKMTQNLDSYSTPKDFFLYLLSTLTLAVWFWSLITLLFTYINFLFPTSFDMTAFHNQDTVRIYIVNLIIATPVFIYTSMAIRRDYLRFPEKKNIKIRKWLLYFTLFISAVLIMSDLGTLLYYFLGGDVTIRFLLKVLIILALSALLFFFYIRELHQGWKKQAIHLWLITLLTVLCLTLFYGFFLIGSPKKARLEAIDNQRVEALIGIQYQLLHFWSKNHQLPTTLNELTDNVSGFKAPTDPVTNQPFAYQVLASNRFQLCANFTLPSTNEVGKRRMATFNNWNWVHPAGFYCFQRTIDPQKLG